MLPDPQINNENERQIPFNLWSTQRIINGMKICTSRHKKYKKDKRVYWISPKLPFWFIKSYLWQPEGAKSPEELQEIVNEIYNRKVSDNEEFYVHFGNFLENTELFETNEPIEEKP